MKTSKGTISYFSSDNQLLCQTDQASAEELLLCQIEHADPEQEACSVGAMPSDEVIYKATQIFSALADSTRFKILMSLAAGELCVCELQEICGVSQSAVSHQLRLLRDCDLVRARRVGQRAVYRLADSHVLCLLNVGVQHASEA
ncbi:MAG: metalloregulator ArsR/SmtB family transcription factor [Coriobacteriales bacterium]|jgi:ArsR family transcriptional regulator|nr:metalloregulator ArsR/SmtB family transcription factor [Coriobacteriales bacterium]